MWQAGVRFFMKLLKQHIEWIAFTLGILALAFMDPETSGTSFCLFNFMGIEFCPGDGLGHSISYTFRADLESAFKAHLFGPFALLILIFRIIHIWKIKFLNKNLSIFNRDENGKCT